MVPVTKICPTCGKDFRDAKHPNRIYCSGACVPHIDHKVVKCETCGKEFLDKKHPNRKYCSQQCAIEKHHYTVICECGKTFDTTYKLARKYCSPECRYKYMRKTSVDPVKWEVRTCPNCGKNFDTWKYREQACCSRECARALRSQQTNVTKPCAICGKPYTIARYFVTVRTSNYCSNECKAIANGKLKRGAGNPNYKGGTVRYRGPNWESQRRKALKRDGRTCQICDKKAKSSQRRVVDVHHIQPYRTFSDDYETANRLSNLITLCKKCHSRVERGVMHCPNPLL